MKLSVPLVAAIAVCAALVLDLAYVFVQLGSASGQIRDLRGQNDAFEAQISSLKSSVELLRQQAKQSEATIGEKGTLQTLAKNLSSGEMDLSLKSLKIVGAGKTYVLLSANAEQGGLVRVNASDGSSTAEIAATPGSTKIALAAQTGADATRVVHIATLGDDGYYLQRGPTESTDTRTLGAGLRLLDTGANFFIAQAGAANLSIETSASDLSARLSLWPESDATKRVTLSVGAKDAPTVVVSGDPAGGSVALLPSRLSLFDKNGGVALSAAEDDHGGFIFVNDETGVRRAIMTAGAEGHGSVSVYGSDKRSNTLFPVYNIQQSGPTQK
jgi:hypothetical protein